MKKTRKEKQLRARLLAAFNAVRNPPPELIGYGDIGEPAWRAGYNFAMESIYQAMQGNKTI